MADVGKKNKHTQHIHTAHIEPASLHKHNSGNRFRIGPKNKTKVFYPPVRWWKWRVKLLERLYVLNIYVCCVCFVFFLRFFFGLRYKRFFSLFKTVRYGIIMKTDTEQGSLSENGTNIFFFTRTRPRMAKTEVSSIDSVSFVAIISLHAIFPSFLHRIYTQRCIFFFFLLVILFGVGVCLLENIRPRFLYHSIFFLFFFRVWMELALEWYIIHIGSRKISSNKYIFVCVWLIFVQKSCVVMVFFFYYYYYLLRPKCVSCWE